MKRYLLLFFLYLFYTCSITPKQNKIAKIDALLTVHSREDLFNGVVLIAEKSNIIYHKAFGLANREWQIPMTTETKFRIGSLSKSFTAMLILQLAEQDSLKLDDCIECYLPDYQGPGKSTITIRQLLTHTSGIISYPPIELEQVMERQFQRLEDLTAYAAQNPLAFKPGSSFKYSNFGYNILALICERILRKPFGELLQERIFKPCLMTDTKNDVDPRPEERLATGYEYDLLDGYQNTTFFDNSYACGSGGVTSTAPDLFKWYRALCDNRLLSKELKTEMYRPTEQGDYGYGWFIRSRQLHDSRDTVTIIEHSGSINGFGSYMAQVAADSLLIIVLKNSRSHNYIRPLFAPAIGETIIAVLYDEPFAIPLKSSAMHLARIIGSAGIKNALAEYHSLKNDHYQQYCFSERELKLRHIMSMTAMLLH